MELLQLVAEGIDDAYPALLASILDEGATVAPRGLVTKELLHATVHFERPLQNILYSPTRKLNYAFSVAEFLWMLLGRNDVKTISFYNKRIAEFSDNGVTFFGAYGPKLIVQLNHYVIPTLQNDPYSRQAVVNIWRESPPATKDYPCTINFHFLVRENKLHMHTYMRSNDAFLGFPYDVYNFTQIQNYVAGRLGVNRGGYTHTVGSMHLYETNFAQVEKILKEGQYDVSVLSTPFAYATPANLNEVFELVSSLGHTIPELERAMNGWPREWRQLIDVLAYRRTQLTALLPEPWRYCMEARSA